MSKQPPSSSFISTTVGPQFYSGLAQSLGGYSPDAKHGLAQPGSPGSPTESGARRWEIRYVELKFDKKLGKGAYGEVWAGTYRKSKVAIKVYDFSGALTPEQQAAVLSEADLMEGLRSEYLIGFRGICFDPRYCLVMEYADGGTLRARLDKASEPIALAEQMRWAMQISYGLYQLHSVRIVHRDLKGENILLDKLYQAKVADFGLSVVKSNSASQSKKGGGGAGAAGTLPWMAPELFERKPNSPASDVYSLGMVLWEILSRRAPFAEVMPRVIVGMALAGKREELPEKCPEIFRFMITACWNADPKNRPTAEQVGDQFERVLTSVEGVPGTVSTESPELKAGELRRLQENMARLELERKQQQTEILRLKQAENERRVLENKQATPTSQNRYGLTTPKPDTKPPVDQKTLGQLLWLVAEGEQDQAEALIQKDKNLLLHAGTVTDLSSREFKGITAFQYALWALDWHMWKMIQKYLPEWQQREQFGALEMRGTAHGKHFSLQPLIGTLQTYVDNAEKVWKYDQRAADHWCKVVGGAQRQVPAHVVNEYCREDRSFEPCPAFTEEKLPRIRTSQYFPEEGEWFTAQVEGKLCGGFFAYVRGPEDDGCNAVFANLLGGSFVRGRVVLDLKALQSLSKARTQQLELLASQLKLTSPLSSGSLTLMPTPKPALKSVDQKALGQLLQFVAEGEQDKAEALIQKDKNLLLHPGTIKDLSGREFKQMTVFQYALWAVDWHMWTMIQKYLPKEAQAQQCQELETQGTGHFSLQGLMNALQTYVDNAAKWNYDQRADDHWCKVVGGAQQALPVHVVNEYCRGDRPFHPCPQEWESKLPRTREMEVYNSTQSKWVKGTWFVAPSSKDGLGHNLGVCRVGRRVAVGLREGRSVPVSDLKALQSLWKTRTQQLEVLRSELLPTTSYSQGFGSSTR